MRGENYTKLDEHSDQADGSNPDAQSNIQAEKQLMRLRPRNSKNRNDGQSVKKFKEMKNIYLDGLSKRVDTKAKTQKIQNKINADQLIKVLQNGRNRRNLRRKQNQDEINQDDDQQIQIIQKDSVLAQQDNHIATKSEQISPQRQSMVHTSSSRNIFQTSQAELQIKRIPKEEVQEEKGNRKKVVQQPTIPEQVDLKLRKALKQMKLQERRTSRFKQEAQKKVPEPELKIKKVLKQMKEQQKRISKLKQQSQWKEIQNLLISKSENNSIESPIKQKQNASRRHELQAAKELLTGKVSIIWVFVISGRIDEADKTRIIKMYNGLSDTPYVVPLCSRASQILSFLTVPNSLFKIVTDLQNCSQVLKTKGNNKIVEFYVYNNKGEEGIAKALSYKSQSRKIKGIFSSLKKLIDRAEEQIQNQVQLFQTKKGLSKKNNSKKFPSFIKLSGEDKTYATLYRANLYGAKNMQKAELQQRYNQFMNLVQQKYGSAEHERKHIADYKSLNHFDKQIGLSQARQIVKFYVRQSFYYQVLNSMLRTMKTTQQFKPCIFPFYQNYHSVKKFYTLDLQQNNRKVNAITLYRGARLRDRDFKNLQPGIFIEMLGFMSTSKSLQRARQFCDRDGYIFVIQVPTLVIEQRFNKYDHGFVDINKHKLASKQFSVEQQVLFNALNVFKITKIVKDGTRHYIHMQYGAIFDLLNKQKQALSNDEKDVLLNYKYCAHMLDEIEDQGDVYMLANQYEQSKQYYKQKIEEDKTTKQAKEGKYYYKLANVQQQCGQLQAANRNVYISLQMQIQNLDINDREKCLKVFSIHSKNAQISLDQEDYLIADQAITQAIQMLDDDNNEFQMAKKFRERGQIKFKKGQIIEAEKDFQRSQMLFKKLTTKASQKKKSISRKYHFSLLTLICSSNTQQQLEKQKSEKLKEVQMLEKQIKNMEEMINQQLIKVNGSLKQVANYAQDKQKYQICVKKARAYLLGVQSRKTNDPIQKAKLKALQATIQDYLELAQSQKLLYEAIQLVQSGEPFNPSVGKYSQILANLQKKQLQKFSSPKEIFKTPLEKGMAPIKYDQQGHNQIYNRCKKNFQKAINVLLYNNNTKDLPEVISLKNQLGELEFHQSKFQQSEKIVKEAKEIKVDGDHSEVARSNLLLSKIGYARGQLRNAFDYISQAFTILRGAIVKKNQQKYLKIFESNDLLLQIKLHRSKIYLKQLNHDLSLKDLEQMKYAIQRKIDQKDSHSLLADIYEIKAQNLVSCHKSFESQFYKALKLRQKQIGQLNLANGVTYCNFAKYLILVQQLQQAENMLHKALQIFTCFSQQHPITWLLLYCTGLMKQKKKMFDDSIEDIRKSLKKAQKKYDKGHITVNKIRLQFAKALQRAGKIQQAIKQFQSLELDLQDEITASQARNVIVDYKDDEKISVKKFLYESLKESYRQRTKLQTTNLKQTTLALDRCDRKMNDLRTTFNIEGKKFKQ